MTGKRALYRRKPCTKTPCSVLCLVGIYNDEEKHMRQEREASLEVGMECGRQIGIKALIRDNQEGGKTKEEIIKKLVKYFELTEEEAEVYCEKYEECS